MRLDRREESQGGFVRQAALFVGDRVEFIPAQSETVAQLIGDVRDAKLRNYSRLGGSFSNIVAYGSILKSVPICAPSFLAPSGVSSVGRIPTEHRWYHPTRASAMSRRGFMGLRF